MNDAVFKFKRYEDDSLTYTGIDTHEGTTRIGGWDTTVEKKAYEQKPFNTVLLGSQETKQKDEVPIYKHEEDTPVQSKDWYSVRVGSIVAHKTFGNGTVKSVDEKYIIINFAGQEKKFLFPQAFEKGFVKAINS